MPVFEEKVLFKNQSKIQSLHLQRKQILLKQKLFSIDIDFAQKSIDLLIFFSRGAFGLGVLHSLTAAPTIFFNVARECDRQLTACAS